MFGGNISPLNAPSVRYLSWNSGPMVPPIKGGSSVPIGSDDIAKTGDEDQLVTEDALR